MAGASGRSQWNHVTTSVGYGGSSQKAVHIGLGQDESAKRIEIRWPGGTYQVLDNVKGGRVLDIEEPARGGSR